MQNNYDSVLEALGKRESASFGYGRKKSKERLTRKERQKALVVQRKARKEYYRHVAKMRRKRKKQKQS